MIEFFYIDSRSKKNISKLTEIKKILYKKSHTDIFPSELLEYILQFITPETIKNEITNDDVKYYFIYKGKEIIGYLNTSKAEENTCLIDIYTCEKNQKEIFEKFLNLIKDENYKVIKYFIDTDLKDKIKEYKKLGFIETLKTHKYIGSDYYLDTTILEYIINK